VARLLRMDRAGAWHHVMSRANGSDLLFRDDLDRHRFRFLEQLNPEASIAAGWTWRKDDWGSQWGQICNVDNSRWVRRVLAWRDLGGSAWRTPGTMW
jgi:hypothetical protein